MFLKRVTSYIVVLTEKINRKKNGILQLKKTKFRMQTYRLSTT